MHPETLKQIRKCVAAGANITHAELTMLLRDYDRLHDIVSRMRKDRSGNPVAHGDVVYDYDRHRVFERHVRTEAWELDENGEPDCAFGDIEDCYGTKAGAEAALKRMRAAEGGDSDE